jgi:hypothetical protein
VDATGGAKVPGIHLNKYDRQWIEADTGDGNPLREAK